MLPPARPLRILRVIARLNVGGPAIQAITLTQAFSENGFDALLVAGCVGPEEGDMVYLAKEHGVAPVFVAELGRTLAPFKDLRAFWKIRKIMCRFRPHIVHTHTAKAGTLGRLAALTVRPRPATVHTFHGHVFRGYFSRLKSTVFILIERMLARFTDRIVVISNNQRREICQTYRISPSHRVALIPLGFDLDPFTAAPDDMHSNMRRRLKPEKAGMDGFLVGCIGRMVAIKNHHMLLAAIGQLKRRNLLERFHFALIGGGELEAMLKKTAALMGIDVRIRFAGWLKDMPQVYAALDAVVLTSFNEGTPVTIIEAMAAGKPVVATDVGGVPDLLGPVIKTMPQGFSVSARGLMVPSNAPEALAAALVHLQENPAEVAAMVGQAREWVLGHYSKNRLVDDLKNLYLSILGSLYLNYDRAEDREIIRKA